MGKGIKGQESERGFKYVLPLSIASTCLIRNHFLIVSPYLLGLNLTSQPLSPPSFVHGRSGCRQTCAAGLHQSFVSCFHLQLVCKGVLLVRLTNLYIFISLTLLHRGSSLMCRKYSPPPFSHAPSLPAPFLPLHIMFTFYTPSRQLHYHAKVDEPSPILCGFFSIVRMYFLSLSLIAISKTPAN